MPTNFKDIRAGIKTAIENGLMTTDEEAGTKKIVQCVYSYDRSTFAGFPAIIISPSENNSDYSSTESDKLTFVFKVRVFYPIKKQEEHEQAENALEEVVDGLLDLFSNRKVLGSACDWVEPTPSAWYYEERDEAIYRVAEINLRCRKYVTRRVCS
jgi:hypothetical protein